MKTCNEIAGNRYRSLILLSAFRANLSMKKNASELNYLEIGTNYTDREGLSTLIAAVFLREYQLNGKVLSIDNDLEHINASKKILKDYGTELSERVTYLNGYSHAVLPEALHSCDGVDVAFIDGGGDPLVNLFEFQAILSNLNAGGIIVIDDLNSMSKTDYYAGRRDFGKATLIYPILLIIKTLQYKLNQKQKTESFSGDKVEISNLITNWAYPLSLLEIYDTHFLANMISFLSDYTFFRVSSCLVFCEQSTLERAFLFGNDENLSNVKLDKLAHLLV